MNNWNLKFKTLFTIALKKIKEYLYINLCVGPISSEL